MEYPSSSINSKPAAVGVNISETPANTHYAASTTPHATLHPTTHGTPWDGLKVLPHDPHTFEIILRSHRRLALKIVVNLPRRTAMKLFSANIEDLHSLYIDNLQKALDMEQHIVKALPKMIEKSTDPELAEAFSNHLAETQGHVSKVEGLLRQATGDSSTSSCKVISALITEAEDTMTDVTNHAVLDVALIAAAQQVEHHEIAVYGTLRNWAQLIGLDSHATILQTILEEEKNADETLTELSDALNTTAEPTSAGQTVR
jgi:ferritin-like metal-binding protein YciE